MIFTDPEQAREAIVAALTFLVHQDGYQQADLEDFVGYEIELLYDDES